MIEIIMKNGFSALSGFVCVFSLVTLILFVIASIANAFMKQGKFDISEIRKLFLTNIVFMLVFALLAYFLI